MAKLFVAKSVFAAVLILTVGVGGGSYPFLPRQLSLAAAITVGIPAFLLALAPAAQAPPKRVHARRGRRSRSRPASCSASRCCSGTGSCTRRSAAPPQQSQTTSLTILVFVGLYLVLVLESGSMRRSRLRGALVPLLVGLLAVVYLVILSLPAPARRVRARRRPRGCPSSSSVICTTFAIGALGLLGLSLTRPGGEEVQVVRFWRAGERAEGRECAIIGASGVWRSLVARSVRVGEVPSSNLGTPMRCRGRSAAPAGLSLAAPRLLA